MKLTASFGPVLSTSASPAPTDQGNSRHPILNDVPAIEMALATLIRLAKREAIRGGCTPERDMAAQQFEQEHGALAALIADPVNEAIHLAASALYRQLIAVLPSDEHGASATRLSALSGPEARYAADMRSRH